MLSIRLLLRAIRPGGEDGFRPEGGLMRGDSLMRSGGLGAEKTEAFLVQNAYVSPNFAKRSCIVW